MTDAQTNLPARYDVAAKWWQSSIAKLGYRAAYEDIAQRTSKHVSAGNIADIGTGAGDLAAAICRQHGKPERLLLIDSSAAMLTQAGSALEDLASSIETRHAALEHLSETAEFDLVLAAHVIEHCAEDAQAIRRLGRLVKPGGHLLLIVSQPHWCQWVIWVRWQHKWYSEQQIAGMVRNADLDLVEVYAFADGPPSRTSLGYLIQRPT